MKIFLSLFIILHLGLIYYFFKAFAKGAELLHCLANFYLKKYSQAATAVSVPGTSVKCFVGWVTDCLHG